MDSCEVNVNHVKVKSEKPDDGKETNTDDTGMNVKSYLSSNFKMENYIPVKDKPYYCSLCNEHFCIKNELILHLKSHTGDEPFFCNHCSKRFNKSAMILHLKFHVVGNWEPYKVSLKPGPRYIYKNASTLKSELELHLETHTGENLFACSICNKNFSKSFDLEEHVKSHTKEKPFACSLCKKGYFTTISLENHVKKHNGKYVCINCKESFSKREDLVKHIRTTQITEKYNCMKCCVSFKIKDPFDAHECKHNKEKPFTCKVCDRMYKHIPTLRKHVKTHKNLKAFTCNLCDKHYSVSHSLSTHILQSHKVNSK